MHPVTPDIPQFITSWLEHVNTTWPSIEIKIEKGKKYLLQNGEIIGPMIPTSDQDGFCWKFLRPGTKWHRYWNSKGIRWCVKSRPQENVVAEYIEPISVLQYEPWDSDSMPTMIKVKIKTDGTRWIASPLNESLCQIGSHVHSYKYLFDQYTQLDGTPCGKLKDA